MSLTAPQCACPYPKVAGSIAISVVAGMIASVIPMIFTLVTQYGIGLESLSYVPNTLFEQLGKVFGYFPTDGMVGFLSLILVGAIIGMTSGSIGKALSSSILFIVIDIVIFSLFGLMVLGVSLDYSKFANLATFDSVFIMLAIIIPACMTSAIIQNIVKPEFKPKPIAVSLSTH